MLFLITLALATLTTLASPVRRDFGPVTVFNPPSTYPNPKVLYARSLLLNDAAGTLLSTWENYTPTSQKPYFPIYKSTDHGQSWTSFSTVQDTVNGWGLRYQPHMIQLTATFAGYPKGTILIAGNSIPADLSKTQLDLYASTDSGATWKFVSHIASGGAANVDNGQTPVWEPFLMIYSGQLVCYYSDQRDPAHGQKLVYQATTNLVNWGSVVNTVAYSAYGARPGMATVSLMNNGQYFLTYEYCGGSSGAPEGDCSVYFRTSSNPLNFAAATGQAVKTTDGHVPFSSPYNVWTSVGSSSGTVVVTAYSDQDVFVNHNYGKGAWSRLTTQVTGAYSRSLAVGFNPKDLLIASGGALGGSSNVVQVAARDVNGCSTCS